MAAIDIDMSEFTAKTTLAGTDYITGTLADGSAVKIKVSDIASVVAGMMPFQRVIRGPIVEGAGWIKLGTLKLYSAACLIYSNVTFINIHPAIFAITAYNYYGTNGFRCKLLAGEAGTTGTSKLKTKVEGDIMHIWATSSNYTSPNLMILLGEFSYDGTIENPPSDAVEPSY